MGEIPAMVKVTLEVPEEVATLLKAMEAKLQAEAKAAREFAPVDPEGALRLMHPLVYRTA
ncbi:hypothetical protein [Corallococcus sp. RDP092CA]|uniref:hypothetical protein n=1 Tax=Corallococcus sp. RDP092CA TaxID=3109369 RepID=UPI0035B49CB1